MARVEHIAMWVRDLDRVCAFYAAHFGAVVGERYDNPSKGFASRFLTFDGGARIEVMTSTTIHNDVHDGVDGPRIGLAHVALALGSERAVDDLTARLRSSGARVVDGPRRTGDGYYESVVLDPEGNRLELTAVNR